MLVQFCTAPQAVTHVAGANPRHVHRTDTAALFNPCVTMVQTSTSTTEVSNDGGKRVVRRVVTTTTTTSNGAAAHAAAANNGGTGTRIVKYSQWQNEVGAAGANSGRGQVSTTRTTTSSRVMNGGGAAAASAAQGRASGASGGAHASASGGFTATPPPKPQPARMQQAPRARKAAPQRKPAPVTSQKSSRKVLSTHSPGYNPRRQVGRNTVLKSVGAAMVSPRQPAMIGYRNVGASAYDPVELCVCQLCDCG